MISLEKSENETTIENKENYLVAPLLIKNFNINNNATLMPAETNLQCLSESLNF